MSEAQVVILDDYLALPDTSNVPGFFLPPTFKLQPADKNLVPDPKTLKDQNAQLGDKTEFPKDFVDALHVLRGQTFSGPGFNQIFRPLSQNPELTKDKPTGMPAGANNLLELNLTHEIWNFGVPDIGQVPNRGFGEQKDVFLNGLVYSQSVLDITNTAKDKGGPLNVNAAGVLVDDNGRPVPLKEGEPKPRDIHFETGMFLNVPATRGNPEPTLSRMASIPHGTTINLQGRKAFLAPDGIPFISDVDITPFDIGKSSRRNPPRPSQDVTKQAEARLPQNLDPHAKFITQELLDDPNSMMNDHNKNKTFKETIVFILSNSLLPNQSNPLVQAIDALQKAMSSVRAHAQADIPEIELQRIANELSLATNIGNIAFLDGPPNETNASVAQVSCIFWVSTVEYVFNIPRDWSPLDSNGNLIKDKDGKTIPLRVVPQTTLDGRPYAKGTVPTFAFHSDKPIKAQEVRVEALQMQYTQTVLLNFGRESWPHVSVATVVPMADVVVPKERFRI